jgi:molybdate transport system substrate-binding protein
MNLKFPAAILLLFSSLASLVLPARADELRVAVAANFADTLAEIATPFEQSSGHRIVIVRGSTGQLYAQLLNGAPYDIFFAADARRPALLEEQGHAVRNSRFSYAIGRLVLWSPDPLLIDGSAKVLATGEFDFMAIANPKLAPYGEAAQQFLTSSGLWDALQPRLVRGENINQTLQFVASGNAALGLIARSQLAYTRQLPAGSRWQVPVAAHEPIVQQAIIVRDSATAHAFIKFVRSDIAQSIIAAHGYDLPSQDE